MGGKPAGKYPAMNEEFVRMCQAPSGGLQGRPSDRRACIRRGLWQSGSGLVFESRLTAEIDRHAPDTDERECGKACDLAAI
jgi:hypothetical protein